MFKKTVDFIREIYNKPEGFIPLHAPVFQGNEKKYLLECIDSTFVSSVGKKLVPFYDEIAKQNKNELFRLRIYSLFQTFRASGNSLPIKEKINLNILPGIIFKIFKVLMFTIFFLTYITAFFHFILRLPKIKNYDYWQLFILILLIGYFPVVHFYANVLGDANRFKFPAEPLIISLFVYYFNEGLILFNQTYNKIHRKFFYFIRNNNF